MAGDSSAFLHPLRERSRVASQDKIVKISLPVFGVGLEKGLIDAQDALDPGLVLCQIVILFIGILKDECSLCHHHCCKEGLSIFLVSTVSRSCQYGLDPTA